MDALARSLAHHLFLRDRLRAEFPDEDDASLAATLEGLSDLDQALAAVARNAHEAELYVEAIDKRMAEMKERAERLQRRADRLRQIIAETMERAALKKITAPDVTLSLRPVQPRVIITDESQIPPDYYVTPAPKLSKTRIKAALDKGEPVPGCSLSNGGVTTSLRWK